MILRPQDTLNSLLEQVAKSLDVPEELYRAAVDEYGRLAYFLEEIDQAAGRRPPEVYPQGSFALGTAIQPIKFGDEYDVDLVYERNLKKEGKTQQQLKDEAGENLRAYVEHCRQAHQPVPRLIEGSRCWCLNYPSQFHMDVLPAIPDEEQRELVAAESSNHILITDRKVRSWLPSNPREFAKWFRSTMEVRYQAIKRSMAAARLKRDGMVINEAHIKEAAEQIPKYEIKTPLQLAVQILKRHRDRRFDGDPENRPASILITTLAAKAYDNEDNVLDALTNLVHKMPEHIEYRMVSGRRIAWVANPVNDDENFADRWQTPDYPDREKHFRSWLERVSIELEEALKGGGIHRVIDLLGASLGHQVVEASVKSLGLDMQSASAGGRLSVATSKATLVTGAAVTPSMIPVRGHTFYGDTKNKK